MFQNIVTGEIEEFKGIKDFTPYKEKAPYDLRAASEVCIDILKAVMKLRHAGFYNTVTEIILKHGFRHRNFEHGKWEYTFTYAFKRNGILCDVLYTISIIFNDNGTVSDVIIDENLLPGFDTAVKDTIYVNFVTRYNYCRPKVNPNYPQFNTYAYLEKIAKDHEAQLSAYDKIAKIAKDYEEEKMDINEAKRIYCKFDNEQREAIKTIWDDSEKNLLKELGDIKKEIDISKRTCKNYILETERMQYLLNSAYGVATAQHNKFEIKEIIINEPAMIIFWKDGTKTVVTAQEGETFDEEKGLAMAYAKKALGNNYAAGGRFKQRLKHAKRVNKAEKETDISKIPICKEIMDEAMRRVKAEMEADAAKEPTEKPVVKKATTKREKK
jgi:hypothetical protein